MLHDNDIELLDRRGLFVTRQEMFNDSGPEPLAFSQLREWAKTHGATIHPPLRFTSVDNGTSVIASENIPEGTSVVSCPFQLAITPSTALDSIPKFLKLNSSDESDVDWKSVLSSWSERMLICTYLVAHWIARDNGELKQFPVLAHMPYLDSLPPHRLLSSSLTFNSNELKLVKGTNLLGATQSRKDELLREHQECQSVFTQSDRSLAERFTFERYLTAAIYLSSRAFPSTLLDRSPTVVSSPDSPAHPVLLPIVDSLNHARGQPVTWLVENSLPDSTDTSTRDDSLRISVVCGTDVPAGGEVFNNYGAKPNSELILGYGFALENNPDDTIVLQLSGSPKKWEVGRKGNPSSSRTLQALFEEACETTVSKWKDVTRKETGAAFDDEDIEDEIILLRRDATLFLLEATRRKLQALPPLVNLEDALNVRQAVREMVKWYVQGQHDVLNYVNEFFEEKLKTIEAELDGMGIQYLSDDEGPST